MELKKLVRLPFEEDVKKLADAVGRRGPARTIKNVRDVERLHRRSEEFKQADVDLEEAKNRRKQARAWLIKRAKEFATHGIFGFEFDDEDQTLTVYWYPTTSWRITDLAAFRRSWACRRSKEARGHVDVAWKLADIEELLPLMEAKKPGITALAKASMQKKEFQEESGAVKAPLGTSESTTWNIKVELGLIDDEQD